MSLLVSVEELAAHPEWRVFDCRHDLKNTGYGRRPMPAATFPVHCSSTSTRIFPARDRQQRPPSAARGRRFCPAHVGLRR
jgi:hypothetical protein